MEATWPDEPDKDDGKVLYILVDSDSVSECNPWQLVVSGFEN